MSDAFSLCGRCLTAYQSLRYDATAKPVQNAVPFGDIFWSDEHPFFPNWAPLQHHSDQMPGENPCYRILVRLVSARYSIWHGKPLTEDLRSIWDSAQQIIPTWPGFARIDYNSHIAAIEKFKQQLAAPVAAMHGQIVRSGADCPRCKLQHTDYRLIMPDKSLDSPYMICRNCGRSLSAEDFGGTPVVDQDTA